MSGGLFDVPVDKPPAGPADVRTAAAFLLGDLISVIGDAVTVVALPWYVLTTTGSVAKMAIVAGSAALSMALASPPGGWLVDRFGPKAIYAVSAIARALSVAVIPLADHLGVVSFPLIVAATFVSGTFGAPHTASAEVAIARSAAGDKEKLGKLVGLSMIGNQLALALGPAAGGYFVLAYSPPTALWIDAATFLLGGLVVAIGAGGTPRQAASSDEETVTSFGGVFSGIKFMASSARLVLPALVFAAALLVQPAFMHAWLPAYVKLVAKGNADRLGTLLSAIAVTTIVGAIASAGVAKLFRGDPMRVAVLAMLGLPLALWGCAYTLAETVVTVGVCAYGVSRGLLMVSLQTTIQAEVPEHVRGRVTAAVGMIAGTIAPIGMVAGGALIEFSGVVVGLRALAGVATVLLVAISMAYAIESRRGSR